MKKVFLFISLFVAIVSIVSLASNNYADAAVAPTDTGIVTIDTSLTGGTYNVWSRMKAGAAASNDSFYLQIDEQTPILIGNSGKISHTQWNWINYKDGNTTSKITLNLSAGNHIIKLIGDEDNVSVDRILMTRNLDCVPVGFGDNCPENPPDTPTPTHTPTPTTFPSATPTHTPTPTPTNTPTPTPVVDPSIVVTPSSVLPGGTVNVEVRGGPGFVEDWVALYKLGNSGDNWEDFQYLNGSKNPPQLPLRSADLTFTMPNENGQYIFRFLENDLNIILAESEVITVGTITPPADLRILGMSITLATNSCTELITQTTIINDGSTAAGAFVLDVNGTKQNVAGLGAGKTLSISTTGYISGANTATVDVNNDVEESNENNNTFTQNVPIPTLPLSCIPTSTPTPLPSSSILNIVVKLDGIGSIGDNVNPGSGGNTNPLTTVRTITLEFFDIGDNLVNSVDGNIIYSSALGYFSGEVEVDNLQSGNYTVRVKTHKYLKNRITGIINIIQGQTNDLQSIRLTAGDINSDNALTISDYNILIGCYSDLLPATDCDATRQFNADLTDDGLVNQDDYNLFLRESSVQSGA